MKNNTYKKKKVLIMGLGLHGGGTAVANFFVSQGARVRITDLKTKRELILSIKKINSRNVGYTLGRHATADFLWADIVIQNPAVPRESKYLKIARGHGAIIENEATIFFKLTGRQKIIGVTGTRGKTTTATLLHQLLKKKFKNALLGGNISTEPMFKIYRQAIKTPAPVVLELSSWQLENLGEKRVSPHIGIFTNLLPDHLNRYKNLSSYGRAKENLIKFQDKNDFSILNFDNPYTRQAGKKVSSRRFWFSKEEFSEQNGSYIKNGSIFFRQDGRETRVLKVKEIKLRGRHNLENILAAITAAMIIGVKADDIRGVIKNFSGVAYRLEMIKKLNGIKFYNDTTATTPDATMAALDSLGKKKNIILITGGSDKGVPQKKFNELGKLIKKYCKAVILFKGQGSKKIKKSLTAYSLQLIADTINMNQAVNSAKRFAEKKDIILLSPACASFGLFINEFDRGNQFNEIVSKLK